MKITIRHLTGDNLSDAPEWEGSPGSCRYCLYWEQPEFHACATGKQEGAFQRKLAWINRVRKEFGNCGKLLYLDNRAVGYAQYAPARYLPNAGNYPAGPVSADAVLIACLFIPAQKHRANGLGSMLLQDVLDELRGRGVRAVEAFARKGNPENPAGPLEFYLGHGFHVLRDDPEFPLLRLNLGTNRR